MRRNNPDGGGSASKKSNSLRLSTRPILHPRPRAPAARAARRRRCARSASCPRTTGALLGDPRTARAPAARRRAAAKPAAAAAAAARRAGVRLPGIVVVHLPCARSGAILCARACLCSTSSLCVTTWFSSFNVCRRNTAPAEAAVLSRSTRSPPHFGHRSSVNVHEPLARSSRAHAPTVRVARRLSLPGAAAAGVEGAGSGARWFSRSVFVLAITALQPGHARRFRSARHSQATRAVARLPP